jgi:hypothetical protein
MRTWTKLLTGLGAVIALTGACLFYNPTRTVTWNEFAEAAQPNLHNTIITTSDYCGSRDGFDYFVVRPPMSREQKYRVLESDSPIRDRFAFTRDRSRWRRTDVMSGTIITISTNQIAPSQP